MTFTLDSVGIIGADGKTHGAILTGTEGDCKNAAKMWSQKVVIRRAPAAVVSHQFDTWIYITTDHGELEDVPAVFDFDVDYYPDDKETGGKERWEVSGMVELVSFRIGGLELSRYDLIDMTSKAVVEGLENSIGIEIQTAIDEGDLEMDE